MATETKKPEAAAAAAPPIEARCLTLRQKLVEMRKACPEIVKKKHSEGVKYKYAKIYDVWEKITPIMNELGVDRGAGYLKKMDLPVDEEDKTLALALGGMKYGYILPALADGYATFANGAFCPARTIARVTDGNGNVLFEHAPEARRVFSADVCALVNDMLQTCVREGTAKALGGFSFPLAAKTGTAEGETGNSREKESPKEKATKLKNSVSKHLIVKYTIKNV